MKIKLAVLMILALVISVFSGCDYLKDDDSGGDKNESCSIGISVESQKTQCKYHVTILVYCDDGLDFVTWSFDGIYWSDVDMKGKTGHTFEQQFPGPGTYAINVVGWRDGEAVASRYAALAISCQ